MNRDFIELNQIGLHLAECTYDYLVGLDSEKMWEARGLTAYNQNATLKAELKAQRDEGIAQLQGSPQGQKRLKEFTAQCREVMRAIMLGNQKWLGEYLGERHFVFLCGLHRSGGSYLLDELSTLYNYPYRKYHCMHDDLPSFFPMIYWKWPHMYLQYIAEVAQFLVIVRESVPWKIVVKKRALWTFAIESLAHIFHGRMTIFLHARHPISWAWGDTALREGKNAAEPIICPDSMKQYGNIYGQVLPENASHCQRMIEFWRLYHIESMRKHSPVHVLPFGEYDAPLRKVASELKSNHEPSPFNPTARDYTRYEEYFDLAESTQKEVQEHWARHSKVFPALKML